MGFRSSSGGAHPSRHPAESHPQVLIIAPPPAQQRLAELALKRDDVDDTLVALRDAGFDEALVRECLWRAATSRSSRGWFKLIDTGQVLGEIAAVDDTLATTPAGQALSAIHEWAYGAD
ncbi:MAG: hypothetical protein ACRDT6_19515 [Micromonosporaceae bacterium]